MYYTPDGKYILQSAADMMLIIDANTLELVAKEAGRAGVPALARPVPVDDTAAAFCPYCRDQYRAGFSRCHECDAALEPFAA